MSGSLVQKLNTGRAAVQKNTVRWARRQQRRGTLLADILSSFRGKGEQPLKPQLAHVRAPRVSLLPAEPEHVLLRVKKHIERISLAEAMADPFIKFSALVTSVIAMYALQPTWGLVIGAVPALLMLARFCIRLSNRALDPHLQIGELEQPLPAINLLALEMRFRSQDVYSASDPAVLDAIVEVNSRAFAHSVSFINPDQRRQAYTLWSDLDPRSVLALTLPDSDPCHADNIVATCICYALSEEGVRNYVHNNLRPFHFTSRDLVRHDQPELRRALVLQTFVCNKLNATQSRRKDAMRVLVHQLSLLMAHCDSSVPVYTETISDRMCDHAQDKGFVPVKEVVRSGSLHTICVLDPCDSASQPMFDLFRQVLVDHVDELAALDRRLLKLTKTRSIAPKW